MARPEKNTPLGIAGGVALVVLGGFLAASIWYAIHAWMALSGVAMSPMGWFFLAFGIVFTIALGAGLMALVFYSSRHHYDR